MRRNIYYSYLCEKINYIMLIIFKRDILLVDGSSSELLRSLFELVNW